MRVSAFIPARGGSARIPRKNLATVGAHSLLERAVFSAFDAGVQPVVSTDNQEIAAFARRLALIRLGSGQSVVLDERLARQQVGHVSEVCQIHDRPAELADAHAQIEAAISHWWENLSGPRPDAVVLLQPTSPFRTPANVRAAVRILETGEADCVVGVRDISQVYAFRGTLYGLGTDASEVGWYAPERPRLSRPRSQDIRGTMYAENGALYAWTRRHWERNGDRMWGKVMAPLVMDEIESMDVDTPEDLEICRAIADATGR